MGEMDAMLCFLVFLLPLCAGGFFVSRGMSIAPSDLLTKGDARRTSQAASTEASAMAGHPFYFYSMSIRAIRAL